MTSTLEKDLKIIDGKMYVVPKEYPNWYGIENIGFIWHGEWADPEIEYNGDLINSCIIEDTMWERYNEDCKEMSIKANEDAFGDYMRDHEADVYELIEIALGYWG